MRSLFILFAILFNAVGCLITQPIWESMIDSKHYKYYGSLCGGIIRENKKALLSGILGHTKNRKGLADFCLNPNATTYSPDTLITGSYKENESKTFTAGVAIRLNPPEHVEGSTYKVSPTLPIGVTMTSSTGIISGILMASQPSPKPSAPQE